MKGVIKKQTEFVSVVGIAPIDGMKTPPTRSIKNGEEKARRAQALAEAEKKQILSKEEQALKDAKDAEEAEQQRLLDEQIAKFEAIKAECEKECEEILNKAYSEAEKIVSDATAQAEALRQSTENECQELKKSTEETAYNEGFKAGEKPGYDDGYSKGKEECAAALSEVSAILNGMDAEKEKIFKEYENQLFDAIFTIANKITVNSLNQKDKSVIAQMLKEAAKSFRGSSYVKVSLSKLDIEESANVDLDDLRQVFGKYGGNLGERQHIEFEILKDAPKGTLILDNGSEIADAGIATQLKMIENLGKGKFKHKPEKEEAEKDVELDSEQGLAKLVEMEEAEE